MRRLHAFANFVITVAWLGLAAPAAHAQPDYGIDFVTIGHPGNRNTTEAEAPLAFGPMGAVNYEYRMSREPIAAAQFDQFVQAYAPYVANEDTAVVLGGEWYNYSRMPDGHYSFTLRSGFQNYAAEITWEMAARYCNWLCNDKRTDRAAFENGAYDTSTFNRMNLGGYQLQHNPDAQFWIPSLDEFIKAFYYDPNRYGAGQEGYWMYPNGSDSPLIHGLPGTGAETIGEEFPLQGPFQGNWDLGQYPDTLTPSGLLDATGTLSQLTSTQYGGTVGTVHTIGANAGSVAFDNLSWITATGASGFYSPATGLRLASVPAPCSAVILGALGLIQLSRLRRRS